jgi:hypothetical protein
MDSSHQSVDVVLIIVESERGARRRRYAKALHHRHGAMMSRPYGDSFLVENGADVMGMDMIENK